MPPGWIRINLRELGIIYTCIKHLWSAPSHYLNQCWIIVNWTLANIFQWKFNTTIFIARQKMSSAKWRPSCLGLTVLMMMPPILGHTTHFLIIHHLVTCPNCKVHFQIQYKRNIIHCISYAYGDVTLIQIKMLSVAFLFIFRVGWLHDHFD